MSIDPRYIASSDLELYLVDKTTGEPLTEGTVEFFSDVDRDQHKAIYTISGSPPNYSFVELPNPSTLSGVGTFQDEDGNNVIPYYYPYDADGNVERYYIEVKSSDETEQFTREAWPPNIPGSSASETANAVNYIPNGQFLSHTDIPADILNNIPAGQIQEAVTEIAQGGWTFARPEGSAATDNLQFFRFGEYVENPANSPRFAVQIVCTNPDISDAYKDLRVRFYDVNKFASETESYTFGFTAVTFNSGNFNVNFNVIKNYGTGGSPSPEEVETISQFMITDSEQAFQVSFTFGSNEGKGIGTNNDDYVELAISFPTNISFGSQLTDFVLFFGNVSIATFPPTTNADFMARSLTAPPPDVDGSDLYLPLVLTKEGLAYDDSQIGLIETAQYAFPTSLSDTTNLMLCDGSQYLVSAYSDLGIPFSRIWNKAIWDSTLSQPKFGTGSNFISTYIQESSTSNLFFSTNRFGATTAPADGVIPTGFTFFSPRAASGSGYGLTAYQSTSTTTFCKSITVGHVSTAPTANTSGFTITVYRNPTSVSAYFMFTITAIAATTLAGKYFRFTTLPGPINYYMWFTVDGSGADPAIGGATGIKVDLKSTYTAADVSAIVTRAIAGTQVSIITTVSGSSVTAGSYFTFGTPNASSYIGWYKVDGSGNAPSASATLKIEIDVSASDTAAQIATKTMIALNSTYFAAPQLQGVFLRGFDPNKIWDLGADSRLGWTPDYIGNLLGTFEIDNILAHSHPYVGSDFINSGTSDGGSAQTMETLTTSETGIVENTVINYNVNWAIRY